MSEGNLIKFAASIVLGAFILGTTRSVAQELPSSMAALGDSKTAGALAGIPRPYGLTPLLPAIFASKIIPALTTGALAAFEDRHLSWSTGIDPYMTVISHARRLAYMNPKFKIYNAAISGAVASDVEDFQLPSLNMWSRKNLGQEYPDYITILIGANDLCGAKDRAHLPSTQDYFDRIDGVIHDIVSRSPKTKILLSSIPKIHSLKAVAEKKLTTLIPGLMTCADIWRAASFCKIVQQGSPEDIQAVAARTREFNDVLKDTTERYNTRLGDRLRYAPDIWDYNFKADELSIDCFHPNMWAQNTVSYRTFEHTWWNPKWKRVEPAALERFRAEKKARQRRRIGPPHRA